MGPIDFRQLARRAAGQTPAPVAVTRTPEAAPSGLPPQRALDLLGEVSTALPALMARCHSLEASLASVRDKSRADLEAATEVAREWQGIADTLRAQLDAAETASKAFRARAETAEAELAHVRTDADRAQQAAAEAECLSSLFQEKVIAAFGVGSPGHAILESVRNRGQAQSLA